MELIGMLDSPYVRRVALGLQVLGLPFRHRSVSVFRGVEEFRRINPVVKAPTLLCDDATVLMDSTLILAYAQVLSTNGRRLAPAAAPALQQHLRRVGLALAVCEKAVQLVYERNLRPAEKQHAPWLERVGGQLLAACDALESDLEERAPAVDAAGIDDAGISVGVAWHFTQAWVADDVPAARFPRLAALSTQAETLPAFRAAPHGDLTYPVAN